MYYRTKYQHKLIKMRAELAGLNDCAVPFCAGTTIFADVVIVVRIRDGYNQFSINPYPNPNPIKII